jgi:hypothetical protein
MLVVNHRVDHLDHHRCVGVRIGSVVWVQDEQLDSASLIVQLHNSLCASIERSGYSSSSSLARGVTVAHLILVQRVEVQIFAGQLGIQKSEVSSQRSAKA